MAVFFCSKYAKIISMAANNQQHSLLKRYRGLTAIGLAFCFFLLPMWLINLSLTRSANLHYKAEKELLFQEMNDRLNFLAKNTSDSHYYHKLLSYYFNHATNTERPVEEFAKAMALLRDKFPGQLRFIIWDSEGKLVEPLSDEKGYRYIVNNLFFFFQEISEHCRTNFPGTPEILPIVEKRTGLFRTILGRFLVTSHLRFPFLAGDLGRCIITETHDRFPLIWFNANSQLTVFAAIKTSISGDNPGITHAIRTLNSSSSIIQTGFIDMRNLENIPGKFSENEKKHLLLELGKFENAAMPEFDTGGFLLNFKILTPQIRGFNFVRKRAMHTGDPDEEVKKLLARTSAAAMVLAWIGLCFSLRLKNLTLSIRLRTIILFVYANGLPLLILATIGSEFLQHKEASLTQEIHRQNERILQEIDNGYSQHRDRIGKQTRQLLTDISRRATDHPPDRSCLNELEQIARQLDADEITIFGRGGETIVSYKKNRRITSQTFVRVFATTTLSFANQGERDFFTDDKEFAKSSVAATSETMLKDNASILKNLTATLENADHYTFGTEEKLCFARLLGNRKERKFNSVLTVFWMKEDTQAAYTRQIMSKLNDSSKSISFASLATHNGYLSPGKNGSSGQLRPWLQKAFNLQSVRENRLEINNHRYILTAIAGKQLANMALSAITPADRIAAEIAGARAKIMAMGFISLLISAGVVLTLAKQFITPVKQLTEAVRQMGKHNFGFRTAITSNDEFGDLGRVFNDTMAEMAELELGRVVQEELLPGNEHSVGKLQIFARTSTMTKLGGDYYDFFDLDNQQTGVFMGDVAGHGIPAALIMAMAKATVLTCKNQRHDPSALLSSLHQMLYRLKSDGFKRMMTCQYLVINSLSGAVSFCNAGHCYPVTVGPNGSSSIFTEIDSPPVGIAKRARYTNQPLQLNPGETMILYSDGMLEATNAGGEIYGSPRFLQLVRDCWDKDLKTYYQKLFQANADWSVSAEDDITIVLIRMNQESENA